MSKEQASHSGDQPPWLSSSVTALLLLLIMVAAAFLRVFQLGENSIWVDEGWTLYYISLPTDVLWSRVLDANPPLYYSLAKFSSPLLGDREFGLRLLSVVFGIATVAIVFGIASLLMGRAAGLVAATVLALSSAHLQFSQEARSYALLVLLVAVSVFFAVLLFQRFREKGATSGYYWSLAGYTFSCLLGLTTHVVMIYYAFATTAAVVVATLIADRHALARRRLPRLPWSFLIVNLAIAVVWLVLLGWLMEADSRIAWRGHVGVRAAASEVFALAGYWHIRGDLRELTLLGGLLAGVGFITAVFRGPILAAALICFFLGVAPVLIWLTGFYQPIFMLRTILPSVIGAALAVGALCLLRPRGLAATLLALYLLPAAVTVQDYYRGYKKIDWRSAIRDLEAEAGESAAKLFCSTDTFWVLDFYARAPLQHTFSNAEAVEGKSANEAMLFELNVAKLRALRAMPVAAVERMTLEQQQNMLAEQGPEVRTLADLAARYNDIWVVTGHCPFSISGVFDMLEGAGFHRTQRFDYEIGSGVGGNQGHIVIARFTRAPRG